ncbi:MAG: TraB/GumN family protein [Planctomycetes bacterium]|nr:TraB/GumN family protein [Planctomycetota bacterium]
MNRSSRFAQLIATTIAALALLVIPPRAQDVEPKPPERPFLWRIDGETPSFLFGTIHLPDERVTTLHAEVEAAIERCDALYTELAMDMKLLSAATKGMMLPRGKTLKTVLPEEVHAKLEAFFAAREMPLAPMERMKPWVIASQVALFDHLTEIAMGKALDLQLYQRAEDDDKEVGGLETIEEQMGVFDGLTDLEQGEMLRKAIDQVEDFKAKGRDLYEELIKSYVDGSGAQLEALMNEADDDSELSKRIEKALLHDRNHRMADRIAVKLREQPQRCWFFAVGAAHAFGNTGLVKLLREQGFAVTRVPESPANLDEEIETLESEVKSLQERIDALRARRASFKKAG